MAKWVRHRSDVALTSAAWVSHICMLFLVLAEYKQGGATRCGILHFTLEGRVWHATMEAMVVHTANVYMQ